MECMGGHRSPCVIRPGFAQHIEMGVLVAAARACKRRGVPVATEVDTAVFALPPSVPESLLCTLNGTFDVHELGETTFYLCVGERVFSQHGKKGNHVESRACGVGYRYVRALHMKYNGFRAHIRPFRLCSSTTSELVHHRW